MASEDSKPKPLFPGIDADADDLDVTEIESLCMNCQANGTTRLLLTKIPFYKDVVVMSFTCDACGFHNNEVQSGAPIGDKGVRYTLDVKKIGDLNRQVVTSDYAGIKIVELDFEIPRKGQKGEITTVEGIIDRIIRGLKQEQDLREKEHPELFQQIKGFIGKLEELKDIKDAFTLILEDISGNSYIQNPEAPHPDPNCKVEYYKRSHDEDHELGIYSNEELDVGEKESAILHPANPNDFKLEDLESEVFQFPTNCNVCNAPCSTNMKLTNIPHFKEVVIMATVCDVCGNRTNEVKSSGGIEPKGTRIEVLVRGREDFSRDLLKSETCSLQIPELQLEVGPHALGGRFTTVEGLIDAMKEQLSDPKYSHMFGDSMDPSIKLNYEKVIKQLEEVLGGNKVIRIILDDPCGNSYIQSLKDNDEPDDALKIEHYERSFEQNEEFGLNDMKTENYEES